ncbi:MAG: HIT family protein [Chloroflexi bacterium]|nr:HIT family protein [Chloroflexota bacterium]
MVIPSAHFESIFDLPAESAAQIHNVAQRVAVAMSRVYRCDGISTRQHNGPGGGQEVWHYHLHVLPRWRNDRLYERTPERYLDPPSERARRAAQLRVALGAEQR